MTEEDFKTKITQALDRSYKRGFRDSLLALSNALDIYGNVLSVKSPTFKFIKDHIDEFLKDAEKDLRKAR